MHSTTALEATVTTTSGLTSHVTFIPVDDPAAPVLVIRPAFGAPASYYRHLTPALAEVGLASLVVEYPGRETRDGIGRETTYGYDALATGVHESVMTHVRELRPDAPVVLLGHSLGGHVSIFAAALHPDGPAAVDGVILAASASPYWRGYGAPGRVRSFAGTALMATVARAVGYWPGDRLKFWGRQSRVLVQDWSRMARTGRVRPSGAQVDYEAALGAYGGQVLAISLPNDSFAPVGGLEQMLRWVPKARVTRWHSPDDLGHIQWVRRNADVVPVIAAWVEENIAAR